MFPNEKARLMRMMNGYGIPAFNAGIKMDFTQRVEWLIEYASQKLRDADADGSKREPTIITDFPMHNVYPEGHKSNHQADKE